MNHSSLRAFRTATHAGLQVIRLKLITYHMDIFVVAGNTQHGHIVVVGNTRHGHFVVGNTQHRHVVVVGNTRHGHFVVGTTQHRHVVVVGNTRHGHFVVGNTRHGHFVVVGNLRSETVVFSSFDVTFFSLFFTTASTDLVHRMLRVVYDSKRNSLLSLT